MTDPVSSKTLDDMVNYYRAHADEYDEWFYRRGCYDQGAEAGHTIPRIASIKAHPAAPHRPRPYGSSRAISLDRCVWGAINRALTGRACLVW